MVGRFGKWEKEEVGDRSGYGQEGGGGFRHEFSGMFVLRCFFLAFSEKGRKPNLRFVFVKSNESVIDVNNIIFVLIVL